MTSDTMAATAVGGPTPPGPSCPVCGSAAFPEVLTLDHVPVEEGRFETVPERAAAAATGRVALHHCEACGLVYDAAPRVVPVEYDPDYSTFMGHSPSFAAHVTDTAEHLVADFGLAGGTVVDIACGYGDFMHALLGAGMSQALGVDPAAHDQADSRITIVREYFSPAVLPADVALVSCRHMLYLLDDPVGFLRGVRAALDGRDTLVYLELMNQEHALAADPWDVTYEHRCYFTASSARRMLAMAGFEALEVEPRHHDRFLGVVARPTRVPLHAADPAWRSDFGGVAARLQEEAARRVAEWRDTLAAVRAAGGRIAAWPAGARAICFLSVTGAGDEVAGVVDLSPARQGRFMPVSARPVVAPSSLGGLDPQVVVVTNAGYTEEIRADLAALGLAHVPIVGLDAPDAPAAVLAATTSG